MEQSVTHPSTSPAVQKMCPPYAGNLRARSSRLPARTTLVRVDECRYWLASSLLAVTLSAAGFASSQSHCFASPPVMHQHRSPSWLFAVCHNAIATDRRSQITFVVNMASLGRSFDRPCHSAHRLPAACFAELQPLAPPWSRAFWEAPHVVVVQSLLLSSSIRGRVSSSFQRTLVMPNDCHENTASTFTSDNKPHIQDDLARLLISIMRATQNGNSRRSDIYYQPESAPVTTRLCISKQSLLPWPFPWPWPWPWSWYSKSRLCCVKLCCVKVSAMAF